MGPPEKIRDLNKLCVHTMTNKPWSLEECVLHYRRAGINGISIWRNVLEGTRLSEVNQLLDDQDMKVVSLVRGGFFPSVDLDERQRAIEDNLEAIGQAQFIGAPMLVLVCGADPRQSQEASREQIQEAILKILPAAEEAGVRLAIEPLHPMYAADRSAITTIRQANDMAEEINSALLGVAVDVFHLWWDPDLEFEITRCGKRNKLFAFHICDWKVNMTDTLNDRGLMGEGCINLKQIHSWMERAGFGGFMEVEVFSHKYWAMDQLEYLELIKKAFLNYM